MASASLREMIKPGALAIISPIAIGEPLFLSPSPHCELRNFFLILPSVFVYLFISARGMGLLGLTLFFLASTIFGLQVLCFGG